MLFSDYLKYISHTLLPKRLLTLLAGALANVQRPTIKNWLIQQFIAQYKVSMQDAAQEVPTDYASFNDFFIRHLKPDCRPISPALVVSPVDGTISEIGRIAAGQLLQAKGRHYSVEALLGDKAQAQCFQQGLFTTLYLSPADYHRVHMPIAGRLREMIYIPGKLFSVQPATTRIIPQLFARNERLVVFFETDYGLMAMVLVGATIVGAIGTSWHGELKRSKRKQRFSYLNAEKVFQKAIEMGYFKLGSTVILLFAKEVPFEWRGDLKAGNQIKLGEPLVEEIVKEI